MTDYTSTGFPAGFSSYTGSAGRRFPAHAPVLRRPRAFDKRICRRPMQASKAKVARWGGALGVRRAAEGGETGPLGGGPVCLEVGTPVSEPACECLAHEPVRRPALQTGPLPPVDIGRADGPPPTGRVGRAARTASRRGEDIAPDPRRRPERPHGRACGHWPLALAGRGRQIMPRDRVICAGWGAKGSRSGV